MRGAYWHIIQTFVGSFLIIISALVIRFTGFLAIDPLLGMAFGVVLLWASWGIIKKSLHILLQGTPEDIDLGGEISASERWTARPMFNTLTPGAYTRTETPYHDMSGGGIGTRARG